MKVFQYLSIHSLIEDHPLLWEPLKIGLGLLSFHNKKIFPTFRRRIKYTILLDVQKLFFPVLMNLLMLFNFFCFIKGESIMFALQNDDDEAALVLIDKVYNTKEENRELILK